MIDRNRLQFVYILNQTMHWFIVGIFIPINALLVVEKGLDLFQLGVVLAFYSGATFLLTLLLVSEPDHPDRQGSLWDGFRKFPQVVSTSVQYGVKNSVVLLLLLTALALGPLSASGGAFRTETRITIRNVEKLRMSFLLGIGF